MDTKNQLEKTTVDSDIVKSQKEMLNIRYQIVSQLEDKLECIASWNNADQNYRLVYEDEFNLTPEEITFLYMLGLKIYRIVHSELTVITLVENGGCC